MAAAGTLIASRRDAPGVARWVGRAAMGVLLLATALAAQTPVRFSLGDSRERVREVQGNPEVVERLASLGRETWSYGNSTITFDPRTGHVVEYVDTDRRLRVTLQPKRATRRDPAARAAPRTAPPSGARGPLTLGVARDDVVRRFGTPWAYTREANGLFAFLAYGRSVVRLSLDDDAVSGWIVRDSAIRVDPRDLAAGELAMGIRRPGGAPPERAAPERAAAERVAPATLRASVRWSDDDGDGVVAPGEGAKVVLTVTNEGPGDARAVRASLRVESPSRGVLIDPPTIGSGVEIGRGSSRTFTFRLRSDSAQSAAEIVAVAGASEASGFDLAPALRLRLPARPAGAPRLVLRDVRVDDGSRDGRLAPREIGDLTIRLANAGTASTRALRVRLVRGADLFLAAGARDTFSLGSVGPGAEATVSVAVYTNTRAAETTLRLEISDDEGRVLARLPIDLPLTGRASGVLDVVATAEASMVPRDGRASSADVDRHLPRAARRRSDAIAVVLGIERYRHLPDARFATRDAALMRRYAVEALGVSDDVEHLYYRSGADVTGGELRKLFGETGWLARRVTENSDVIVYYAGHGAPDGSRRAPYLLPFDADPAFVTETGFALGTLYDRLARLKARSITVILDACFTGLTRDGQALVAGTRPTVLSIEHPALVRRQMAVLTAARDAQAAGDLPEAQHGLLTYWIARGLRGEADTDGDDAITVAELGRFAERRVRETAARLDREQRPLVIARDSLMVVTRLVPER